MTDIKTYTLAIQYAHSKSDQARLVMSAQADFTFPSDLAKVFEKSGVTEDVIQRAIRSIREMGRPGAEEAIQDIQTAWAVITIGK